MNKNVVVEISDATKPRGISNRLKHDLMAPLCNVKAYTNELKQVSVDIEELIFEHNDDLPVAVIDALKNTIIADIDICTNALDRSAESLETQLQATFNNATAIGQ